MTTAQPDTAENELHAVAHLEMGTKRADDAWWRSPIAAAFVLGLCNFTAPGIWVAVNSLGGGGESSPHLVNAANALTFCLMIATAFLSPAITNKVGVNVALFLGGIGFAPYVGGLYANNVHGVRWVVVFGAATCGLSAGLFYALEAAVAISYPEKERLGLVLGIWMVWRVLGQAIGGAINLGLNATRAQAGAINPNVYIVFIALQCIGPLSAFLLPRPHQIRRRDGKEVTFYTPFRFGQELKETARVLVSKEFLLVIPLIVQGVFPESYNNTYMANHFTVRARALGSFVMALGCMVVAVILGWFLDAKKFSLRTRARASFAWVIGFRAALWTWALVINAHFPTREAVDWNSPYFGRTFALYVLIGTNFQENYMWLYFIMHYVAKTPQDAVRTASLLRAIESAAQAVAYGTSAIPQFKLIEQAGVNLAIWGAALLPTWLIVRRIGVDLNGPEEEGEKGVDGKEGAVVEEKGE
ncbi:UNC93-like protein [Vanrija pseudolonga]|uniref:UNC93-like protein n=1 Tax=Vanrija pseudolonga TaxID=143232 RepID=A0AAF1BIK7_9TREE|nr:UNC93-like protein [Vanrija pseudolonga]